MIADRVELNLIEKLIEVAQAVRYITKGGTNTAQGYKFVGEAQVVEKVGPELLSRGVLVYPRHRLLHDPIEFKTAKGSVQFLTSVETTWVFTDGDHDIEVVTIGQGTDSGDKGVFKAMTGSKKYGLLQALMIATGDDPEIERTDEQETGIDRVGHHKWSEIRRSTPADLPQPVAATQDDPPATKAQKDLIRVEQRKAGITDETLKAMRVSYTGKLSSAQFTSSDITKMLDAIAEAAAVAAATNGTVEMVPSRAARKGFSPMVDGIDYDSSEQ